MQHKTKFIALLLIGATCFTQAQQKESENQKLTNDIKKVEQDLSRDPLPSWNQTATKKAIMEFVRSTIKKDSKNYVPVANRIACFDNDGTLWAEQPMYFQLLFAIDRVKAMAPQHPEWKTKQPFQDLLEGNIKGVMAGGEKAVFEIIMATHAGMTADDFNKIVKDWMVTAKHPITGKPYNQMIYQPMVELLKYLRNNGYKTFIVSGGGVDFMRPWVMQAYGIEPYQTVGSSGKVEYDTTNGQSVLMKQPEINFIDDKSGKPVGIHQYIGKIPVFTVGNSDGDYEMLQWTCTQTTPHFSMIIHHTDASREWAYDTKSEIGHLEVGLSMAPKYNFVIMDMKTDWKTIFPFGNK